MTTSNAQEIAQEVEVLPGSAVTNPTSDGESQSLLHELAGGLKDIIHKPGKEKSDTPALQDRLLGLLVQQVFPNPGSTEDEHSQDGVFSTRDIKSTDRPKFSLAVMSNNFRRFNARIGIVFVVQNQIINLLEWRKATHTLSFLSIFSLLCLQPHLVPAIPFGVIFFYVMIPSFMARHPPAPRPDMSHSKQEQSGQTVSTEAAAVAERYACTNSYATRPVAPPQNIRPAPEMSSDFFRNMRDIQNVMEDFSSGHDAAVAYTAHLTDFGNEKISSAVFCIVCVLLSLSFVASHLVPWRFVFLLGGWAIVLDGNPTVHHVVRNNDLFTVRLAALYDKVTDYLRETVETEIVLDEPPEVRQVEIFELQRLISSSSASLKMPRSPTSPTAGLSMQHEDNVPIQDYEPWLFSPTPYVPMTPAVLSNARPTGTRFLGDVHPPPGWTWRDKKWSLDLFADVTGMSSCWVEDRCVTGVEVEVEGERWVYDLVDSATQDGIAGKPSDDKASSKPAKSWEQGNGSGVKGEWRRRRWVRSVERQNDTVR